MFVVSVNAINKPTFRFAITGAQQQTGELWKMNWVRISVQSHRVFPGRLLLSLVRIHSSWKSASINFRIGHGEEATAGCSSRAWRREAKQFLQVGSDAHGAEEVEENHGAVGGIVPGQSAVAHPLDERDGREGQLGNGAALEEGVEQAEDDEEHDSDDGARLELGERELPRSVLEAGLDAVHLLSPRRCGLRGGGSGAGGGGGGAGLHGV
uniref:Uncharacterized protein n=1 Tax=Zea mays TaxID=4577 RepID=C4J310_MAIZE|nr:unknown [Zea mays]